MCCRACVLYVVCVVSWCGYASVYMCMFIGLCTCVHRACGVQVMYNVSMQLMRGLM